MRDLKHQDLIVERLKSADYRQEIEALRAKLASIASINEVLLDENQTLREKLKEKYVVELGSSMPRSG
jgi:regulator of replication initiation timing